MSRHSTDNLFSASELKSEVLKIALVDWNLISGSMEWICGNPAYSVPS